MSISFAQRYISLKKYLCNCSNLLFYYKFMVLSWIDWLIIAAFFALSIGISFRYKQLGESGLTGFFLGGRNLPWYLAGLSMVATTFAADTPLAVTELVAQGGIAKNWLWWNALSGGLLTTIFFTRLWRRSGVLTEVEFIDIRYSGRAAKFLRSFKAVYLGLFINAMIIAWVNLAFMALIEVFFGVTGNNLYLITAAAMVFVFAYSSISGLKGIAVTDAVQFIIAIVGCIILAVLVLKSDKVGGIAGLKEKLPPSAFNLFPSIGDTETATGGVLQVGKQLTLTLTTFLTYIGVLWWSSWYPGAEPGGGGYIAQRIMSAKDEKNSVFATLFFQIAHFCLRPWPWIIVALAALVLYPELSPADQKLGYVMAMKDFLPSGLRGMLLVAFLGAYMSTISTQLNWGASYLINDLYVPLKNKSNPEANIETDNKSLIKASRIGTFIIMAFGLLVTTQITTITSVWEFIFQCGSGLGLVLILRWYWHRINVWSEITATITPFLAYGYIQLRRFLFELEITTQSQSLEELTKDIWYYDFANGVLFSVGITTIVWLIVTYSTKPTDPVKTQKFYDKVKPTGVWGEFGSPDNSSMGWLTGAWLAGIVMVYSLLFCSGKIIFHEWNEALWYGISSIVGFILFSRFAQKGKLFQ
ncbi:MAG: SSS family solute:Na+ symporter [Bacteroidia bacterium]|jgi:SSS family solute:Na+ symporter